MTTISDFTGEYGFLSNFHSSAVEFEGKLYRTVEHAYQAAKTTDEAERRKIRDALYPNVAKKLGRRVTMRPGWDGMKVEVMLGLVRKKFAEPELRAKLLATENAKLVEGNWWHDTFWGVCQGVGKNHLGKILMRVRDEIRKESA